MARILEVDYANQLAGGGAGAREPPPLARPRPGFYYAPDPSSQLACTIGGNVANNSGGPHTLKYGVTTNHVLGLEVVLPDGEIVWLGGKVRDPQATISSASSWAPKGRSGSSTKIVVRIVRRPPAVRTLLARLRPARPRRRGAVAAITARGLTPAALEMIDQLTIQAVEDAFGAGYPRDAAAALLIELDGLETGLDEEAEHVIAAVPRERGAGGAARPERSRAPAPAGRGASGVRRLRARGARVHGDGRRDPAYPAARGLREHRADRRHPRASGSATSSTRATATSIRTSSTIRAKPGEEQRVLAAGAEIMHACVEVGGSISGEHGIGLEKRDFMPWIFSEADLGDDGRGQGGVQPHRALQPRQDIPDEEVLRAR